MPPEPMMSITRAPESAEVTKKVMTISVAMAEVITLSGRRSSMTNRAVGTLSWTAAAMPPPSNMSM
ncbi:hypothetical protein D3C71_2175450 [compost metagenome]